MKLKDIFYFDRLSPWDKISILIYIFLSIIFFWFFYVTKDVEIKRNIIWLYPSLTQVLIYILNYKSLRNLSVFFIWILIGIIHLVFYFVIKENQILFCNNIDVPLGLRNTILMLVVYQILRIICIKTQNEDIVAVISRHGDLFDERKPTIVDLVLHFTYFIILIVLYFIHF